MYQFVAMDGRERRFKTMWVTPELLLNGMWGWVRDGNTVRAITIEGIPEGCEVMAVTWAGERRAFGILLYHQDFAVVEPSLLIPEIIPTFRADTLHLQEPRPMGRQFI